MSPRAVLLARLRRLLRRELAARFAVAALVGATAGYAAHAFLRGTDLLARLLWGVTEDAVPAAARLLPAWQVLAIPALGGFVLGLLMRFVLPGPLPQGVADVIRAAAEGGGRLPLRSGLAAALVSAGSIAVGASVGREGPIVHLGAVLAAPLVRRLRLDPLLGRTLLGCGVAAGIAAAFHAPLAGVFFALEVVIGHYGLAAFSPVVIASLVGTVVTRAHFGAETAFALAPHAVRSLLEIPAFLLLGLLCGLAAVAFVRAVDRVRALHERLAPADWLRPAAGGLAVGLLALALPDVLGVGYAPVSRALGGGLTATGALLLFLAKFAATALALGSRFGGGVFSPGLVLGAALGVAWSGAVAAVLPGGISAPGVYATVGMGALAAAVLGAPVSTVIMVFELTGDYGVTFAVMAAVAVANATVGRIFGHSFFTWQLRRAGHDPDRRGEFALLRRRRVRELLRRDHVTVPEDAALGELWARFHARHGPVFVVDAGERLVGVVDLDELLDRLLAPGGTGPRCVREVMAPAGVVLTLDCDLARAVRLVRDSRRDFVPVVAAEDDRRLVGEVRLRDLLRAYDEAVRRARAAEAGTG